MYPHEMFGISWGYVFENSHIIISDRLRPLKQSAGSLDVAITFRAAAKSPLESLDSFVAQRIAKTPLLGSPGFFHTSRAAPEHRV